MMDTPRYWPAHWWLAWFPLRTDDGRLVWLRWVLRRKWAGGMGWSGWAYQLDARPNSIDDLKPR